jgi:hypothetical protein
MEKNQVADHLLLAVVNDGRTYQGRLAIARRQRAAGDMDTNAAAQAASSWLVHASAKAREITRELAVTFTAAEILDAARQLSAYYAEHIVEVDG